MERIDATWAFMDTDIWIVAVLNEFRKISLEIDLPKIINAVCDTYSHILVALSHQEDLGWSHGARSVDDDYSAAGLGETFRRSLHSST
jgi:hypothetical protein